jgi:hypothetical protein
MGVLPNALRQGTRAAGDQLQRLPRCIHARVVQNLLDIADQLGLTIRDLQSTHVGRSLVNAIAVSLADGHDYVSFE